MSQTKYKNIRKKTHYKRKKINEIHPPRHSAHEMLGWNFLRVELADWSDEVFTLGSQNH